MAGFGPHSALSEEEEVSSENLALSRDNSLSAAIWISEELLSLNLCIALGLVWRILEPENVMF